MQRKRQRGYSKKRNTISLPVIYTLALAPRKPSTNREHVLLNNDLRSLPCFNNICSSLLLTRKVIKLVLIVFGYSSSNFNLMNIIGIYEGMNKTTAKILHRFIFELSENRVAKLTGGFYVKMLFFELHVYGRGAAPVMKGNSLF